LEARLNAARFAPIVIAAALVTLSAINAQAIAIASIHGYQRALAPAAARIGLRCRFTPTCSRYAEAVIARDGVMRGGFKAIGRIARCGPWTAPGTADAP
jgi:putative membrane protein insertion efficiency factor